jgi:aminoglycoside phosphotransferase (APT) family kinase protein
LRLEVSRWNWNRILSILESAPLHAASSELVIAHGDLHLGQLVLDDDGGLAGVIDWGDMHLGERAVDLTVVHQILPESFHDAFLQAYGDVDRTTWGRARARAVWHAVALLAQAADAGDHRLVREWTGALSHASGA